jgi:hypothetical protein
MEEIKMKKNIFIILILTLLLFLPSLVSAEEEDEDIEVLGFELEKLLNLGSALLATGLFILTSLAFKKTNRKRLLYLSLAFLLFAIKGFLLSHELFLADIPIIDPIASFLDFAILLSFFIGVLKK